MNLLDLFRPSASQLRFWRLSDCTLHTVVEAGVYPYRCHRCGRCFLCAHTLLAGRWVCADGQSVPTSPSPSVPISPSSF